MNMPLSVLIALLLASSVAAGVMFSWFVPKAWNKKPMWFGAAITAYCFFLPGLGLLSLLAVSLFLMVRGQPSETITIQSIQKPSYFAERSQGSQFGVGGATQRLTASEVSTQKRTEALLALANLQTAEKNALVRQTLSDDTDQIRLLAFSLLDQQEKKISAEITELRAQYRQANSSNEKHRLEKAIAQQYWELIYHDLVQGDLKNSVLNLAFEFANKAWDEKQPDPQVAILLSKLYLSNHQVEKAQRVLNIAREQGVKDSHVLPYLAAISYEQRDFARLRKYLQENPNLIDVPKLNQVIHFWRRQPS